MQNVHGNESLIKALKFLRKFELPPVRLNATGLRFVIYDLPC